MRLLTDENVHPKYVSALRAEGHAVDTVGDVLGTGTSDGTILEYCRTESVALLTNDVRDFSGLDAADHAGVLILPSQTFAPGRVVRAVERIEASVPGSRYAI